MDLRSEGRRWRWLGIAVVGAALLWGLWLAAGPSPTTPEAQLSPSVETFPSGSLPPRSVSTDAEPPLEEPSFIAWQMQTQRFLQDASTACDSPMPRLLCSGPDCVVLHSVSVGGRWSWLTRILRRPSVVAEALAQRWAPGPSRCAQATSDPPFGHHVWSGPFPMRDRQYCYAIYSPSATAGSADRARAMCEVALDLPTMPSTR